MILFFRKFWENTFYLKKIMLNKQIEREKYLILSKISKRMFLEKAINSLCNNKNICF